jgi:hypothetical protein
MIILLLIIENAILSRSKSADKRMNKYCCGRATMVIRHTLTILFVVVAEILFGSLSILYAEELRNTTTTQNKQKMLCEEDVSRFCGDIRPGEGRIVKCLKEHESVLSSDCKMELAELAPLNNEKVSSKNALADAGTATIQSSGDAGGCLRELDISKLNRLRRSEAYSY